ncbi:MAG TPA: hypothetical protein VG965_04315 [Patescibacteria group bacterium]|nr:hypothetical protein [Patescibacteria group bacterium]
MAIESLPTPISAPINPYQHAFAEVDEFWDVYDHRNPTQSDSEVSKILSKKSDLALAWIANSDFKPASGKLIERMKNSKITQFSALVEIVLPLYSNAKRTIAVEDFRDDNLFWSAVRHSVKMAPTANQEDVAHSVARFVQNVNPINRALIVAILSKRGDIEEVLDRAETLLAPDDDIDRYLSKIEDEVTALRKTEHAS